MKVATMVSMVMSMGSDETAAWEAANDESDAARCDCSAECSYAE